MIVVTGTRRSGTSMWMQILGAAGFPLIGEAFPGEWAETIKAANPRGFYESRFTRGINHTTNPDPATGEYVFARDVPDTVVKIFVPGVARTELAYLDHVVCTVREWRAYAASLRRMRGLEAEGQQLRDRDDDRYDHDVAAGDAKIRIPAWQAWWRAHFRLVRDAKIRRYPIRFVTYEGLLDDPRDEVARVLDWLGCERITDALRAIEVDPSPKSPLGEEHCPHAGHLDRLYRLLSDPFEMDEVSLSWLDDANAEIEQRRNLQ